MKPNAKESGEVEDLGICTFSPSYISSNFPNIAPRVY